MARILIADDDALLRRLVGVHLRAEGHELIEASTGAEALERALADRPDVIVLDHMMPRGDGPSVLRTLRRGGDEQTPVIMLTARNDGEDKVNAFEAGADDYVVKPFHAGELSARIGRALRRR
jgi:DNA-binding response OmpR family regulator